MRARMSVGGDPRAISLIGVPIDKALMVVRDEHLPLRARQFARALLAYAGSVEDDLMTALAICVGACVDRIGEDMIDGDVAWVDPADFCQIAFNCDPPFASNSDPASVRNGAETGGAEPHIAEQSRSWRTASG